MRTEPPERSIDDAPVQVRETAQEGDPYRHDVGVGGLLPRPLRPDARFFRGARRGPVVRLALGGLLLALALLWSAAFARDMLRMHAVWSSGEEAREVQVRGLRTAPGGFAAQKRPIVDLDHLDVAYTDAAGVRRSGSYRRWALLSPIYRGAPPTIKYDRDDPSSFALSPVIAGARGELLLFAVVLTALVACSLVLIGRARRRLRALAETREILHSSPEEVVLVVRSAHRREEKDKLVATEYELQLPEGGTITRSFVAGERPLFLELDESRALGLRSSRQPAQVLVLHDDLRPLAAETHEDERVRLRYRRLGERPNA